MLEMETDFKFKIFTSAFYSQYATKPDMESDAQTKRYLVPGRYYINNYPKVTRFTKNEDLFTNDLVLVPIHQQ